MSADNVGRAEIRAYAERIIRLDDERQTLVNDIKEIRAECKSRGFNVKALNAAIRISRMGAVDREKHEQYEMELSVYVGALDDTSGD